MAPPQKKTASSVRDGDLRFGVPVTSFPRAGDHLIAGPRSFGPDGGHHGRGGGDPAIRRRVGLASRRRVQSDPAFVGAGVRREVALESTSTDLIVDPVRRNPAVTPPVSRHAPRDRGLATLPVVDGPPRSEHPSSSDRDPGSMARAFPTSLGRPSPE